MRRKVALRFKPFSHRPGVKMMIPGSVYIATLYPAHFFIHHIDGSLFFDQALDIQGPVKDFTATLDLEKGKVSVFGKEKRGYFHYDLWHHPEGPQGAVKKGEWLHLSLSSLPHAFPISSERLSMGCSKAQEWEKVALRENPEEIFPFWLRLASFWPVSSPFSIKEEFISLFRGYMEGILVPRSRDTEFQGLSVLPPSNLLLGGGSSIRELFVHSTEDGVTLLPKPFSSCGRMVGIQERGLDIDIEWTKYFLRTVWISSSTDRLVSLKCQKELSSCRVRKNKHEKGARHFLQDPFSLQAHVPLFLDQWR